jgi:homoserine O-acetyltransferase
MTATPIAADYIAKNFQFHTGETLPEVKLHYITLGDPKGEPVLILHGTTGSGKNLLNANFGGQLFGPGQPLDASRYYIILPDALGVGGSSKPSDGLRMKFPRYNYDDQILAHYRLITEHLGVKRLRLLLGNSMGGMQVWLWAQKYPDMMDIAVPMGALPTEMAGRNWMMRRFIVESIKNDPAWKNGEYTEQPKSAKFAHVFFSIATNGGNFGHYKAAPTRALADASIDKRMAEPFEADANDFIYGWESSRDYNPAPGLEKIKAALLAINSEDDERNPAQPPILQTQIKRVKNGRALIIPASEETIGHSTTGNARFWKKELEALLQATPRGSP